MKELIITPPEGYEIDQENSTFEKIVFKEKNLTYNKVAEKLFAENGGFFSKTSGEIGNAVRMFMSYDQPNNATTEEQLRCILAKNKLANVARYLNGNWSPYNSLTKNGHFDAFVIYLTPSEDCIGIIKINQCSANSNVLFKTRELAEQAIQILGEEKVKLALKPLY